VKPKSNVSIASQPISGSGKPSLNTLSQGPSPRQTAGMKSTLKIGLAAVAMSFLFAAGYAKGQDEAREDGTSKIDTEIQSLDSRLSFPADRAEQSKAIEDLHDLMGKSKNSPVYRNRFSHFVIRSYVIDSNGKEHQKAYQDAAFRLMLLQTQQNERIIQLLEQQKGK
jgi:hypothetical protein